jgi:hypothetical protein
VNLAKLIRASGLILALGGLLLICAEIVYILYPGDPEVRAITTASQISAGFFFSGALMLTIGLPGVYLRQAERAGTFGVVAFLLALAGSALMIASDWNELFAGPAMMLIPNLDKEFPATLIAGYMLNYGTYTLGWLLFGIATLRARVLPRPLALLLIGGILLPFVGLFSLHVPGDFMPCYIAFAWLGLAAARAERPARAPLAEPVAA